MWLAVTHLASLPKPQGTKIILKMRIVASCEDDSNQPEKETKRLVLNPDVVELLDPGNIHEAPAGRTLCPPSAAPTAFLSDFPLAV